MSTYDFPFTRIDQYSAIPWYGQTLEVLEPRVKVVPADPAIPINANSRADRIIRNDRGINRCYRYIPSRTIRDFPNVKRLESVDTNAPFLDNSHSTGAGLAVANFQTFSLVETASSTSHGSCAKLGLMTVRHFRSRCLTLFLGSVIGFIATYFVAVRTVRGQLLDVTALDGHAVQPRTVVSGATTLLGSISMASLVFGLGFIVTISFLRRRYFRGCVAAMIVICSVLSTELLKRRLLPRPTLVKLSPENTPLNTLPSGHTTIAISIVVALMFVLPRRGRAFAAFFGAPYATGIGIATIVTHWHRPSDVLAAIAIVGAWTSIGLLAVQRLRIPTARATTLEKDWERFIRPAVFVMAAGGIVSLAITTIVGLSARLDFGPTGTNRLLLRSALAFGLATAIITLVSCAFFGSVLRLLSMASAPSTTPPNDLR
jgi:membrane-associated phospholipid phosphatase